MSDAKPTDEDLAAIMRTFNVVGDPSDMTARLSQEMARVREGEREACATICDALATEAQQKFQPGWLLVTNGHHEAARRIRTQVDA